LKLIFLFVAPDGSGAKSVMFFYKLKLLILRPIDPGIEPKRSRCGLRGAGRTGNAKKETPNECGKTGC